MEDKQSLDMIILDACCFRLSQQYPVLPYCLVENPEYTFLNRHAFLRVSKWPIVSSSTCISRYRKLMGHSGNRFDGRRSMIHAIQDGRTRCAANALTRL
eukprot:scaffold45178_cov237-Amphora_coffeaeformis.AAC.1